MGTARVPHLPAGLPTVPCWGPAGLVPIASFRGDHGRLCLRRRWGHSARPGAIRSRRGQPTRSGTRFPSPTASKVPGRDDMSPAARSAPARAVGPDHEWGTHTDRPFAVPPATGTPSSQPPRAGHRQKQAAPHLRCGARRSSCTGPSPMLVVWRRV